MIAAIDQHVADAGFAHLAEGDFLGWSSLAVRRDPADITSVRVIDGRRVAAGDSRLITSPLNLRSISSWQSWHARHCRRS